MALNVTSGFVLNSVFWLTSPRPDEVRMVDEMMDDISVVCQSAGMPFQRYVVPSAAMLIDAFEEIEQAALQGLNRPARSSRLNC